MKNASNEDSLGRKTIEMSGVENGADNRENVGCVL